jgi:nitroreductase
MALPIVVKRTAELLLPLSVQRGARRRYRALRDGVKLAAAAVYDARSYGRGSGVLGGGQQEVLKTQIIKSYHRIEKGLALQTPRPGFGADAVALLLDDLALYLSRHGADWTSWAALQVLDEYCRFSAAHGVDSRAVAARSAVLRERALPPASTPALGGTMAASRARVWAAARLPFADFVRHRYSVRQFAATPVDRSQIEEAVRQAQFAPSVCNREAGQVYIVGTPERAKALLAHQNGNRGFGERAGALLVVTARQAAFHTVGERYQGWIDGGLFAMTLVYALHAQGLGTCCLNWSVEPAADRAFKLAAGLPQDDLVIMLLAVGHLPDDFSVARSARRPLHEVLHTL